MVLLPMPNIKAKTKFFFGHITLVFIILNHTSFFSIIYNKKNKKGEKIYELLKISKKVKRSSSLIRIMLEMQIIIQKFLQTVDMVNDY